MRNVSKIALAALSTLAVFAGPAAHASGNLAGQLNAQMTLQAGCIISGAAGAGSSGVNFGTLDFGTQPATFTGVLAATASGGAAGAGATQILCSTDITALNVSVSAGSNAGQGGSVGTGTRAMRLGSSSSYLPYEVYSDPAMTTAYPTSAGALSVPLTNTGAALPLPVYGRINKTSATALAAGTYTDVLQVTLSW